MEKVAEHINEMQRIHEEYGAIFDHLFRQHQKSCKQVNNCQLKFYWNIFTNVKEICTIGFKIVHCCTVGNKRVSSSSVIFSTVITTAIFANQKLVWIILASKTFSSFKVCLWTPCLRMKRHLMLPAVSISWTVMTDSTFVHQIQHLINNMWIQHI
jgi:hypothetical protein